ncbi:hypothetical protein LINPERHAP2_LOCUS19488, partial [Linum perenne]
RSYVRQKKTWRKYLGKFSGYRRPSTTCLIFDPNAIQLERELERRNLREREWRWRRGVISVHIRSFFCSQLCSNSARRLHLFEFCAERKNEIIIFFLTKSSRSLHLLRTSAFVACLLTCNVGRV